MSYKKSLNMRNAMKAKAVSVASAGSYSTNYNQPRHHPFGPQMASDIFGIYDGYEEDVDDCGDEEYIHEAVEGEQEYWYQTELPLESIRELEQRHRQQIRKFETAYRKMIAHALKWHYLMEECDENPQIEKMFKDMQMIRKLTGSDVV